MSLNNYAESKLVNHLLGTASFSMPATVYVALFTSDPGESGSFTNEVPSGRGYARQAITGHVSTSSGGSAGANTDVIAFGPCTSTAWGTVTHAALVDGATIGAGNMLVFGALSVSKLCEVGDRLEIAVSALTLAFE